MKLWEIKAQALRLMFADSDLQFSEEEFEDESVYNNSNTRDKLIRMNDTIMRGIDLYYNIVGLPVKQKLFDLAFIVDDVTGANIYGNNIDLSSETTLDIPTRVDVLLYVNDELRRTFENVDFIYDSQEKEIGFINDDYSRFTTDVKFRVWYKPKRLNLPLVVNELEYDLDTIYIPDDVQRMLPYYIKGELYEEDEASVAVVAKDTFLRFLYNYRKPYSYVKRRVKHAPVFDK